MQQFSGQTVLQLSGVDDRCLRIVEAIRDLPFAYTLDRSESFLLRHGIGSCTAKHTLLKNVLGRFGVRSQVVYQLVSHDASRLKFQRFSDFIPPGTPFSHTSLEVYLDDEWHLLDVTFDRLIEGVAPVNAELELGFRIGEIRKRVVKTRSDMGRGAHLEVTDIFVDGEDRAHNIKKQKHAKLVNHGLMTLRSPHVDKVSTNYAQLRDDLQQIGFVV